MKRIHALLVVLLALCCVAAAPSILRVRGFKVNPQPGPDAGGCAGAVRISSYVAGKAVLCCNPATTPVYIGGQELCTSVDGGMPICTGTSCSGHDCFELSDGTASGVYARLASRLDAGCSDAAGVDAAGWDRLYNTRCAKWLNCTEGR